VKVLPDESFIDKDFPEEAIEWIPTAGKSRCKCFSSMILFLTTTILVTVVEEEEDSLIVAPRNRVLL